MLLRKPVPFHDLIIRFWKEYALISGFSFKMAYFDNLLSLLLEKQNPPNGEYPGIGVIGRHLPRGLLNWKSGKCERWLMDF